MAQQAILRLQIAGPGATPEYLDLSPGETSIGRADTNALVLPDKMVSRIHARIECISPGTCQIIDLNSANGTLVNGRKLAPGEPTLLDAGAVVKIGPFTLTVQQVPLRTAPAAEYVSPPVDSGSPPKSEPDSPPVPPAAPPPSAVSVNKDPAGGAERLLPGLTLHSQRLLHYLPDIYQPPCDDSSGVHDCFGDTDFGPQRFMSRLLGLFESILLPIEWTVDNFDLFLDPRTSPAGFLNWLANWFEITFDASWTGQQQRTLLREAHEIYARRGTRKALSRMIEIYTGQPPEI
ncbi:MAG: FHA domain-containing protein, partial [Caldilinea sp.]